MCKISERKEVIPDLFMILFLIQLEENNHLLDSVLKILSIPTLCSIIATNKTSLQLILNIKLEDAGCVANLFAHVIYNQYLHNQLPAST